MNEAMVDLCSVGAHPIRLYVARGRAEDGSSDTRLFLLDEQGKRGEHSVNTRIVSVDAHAAELYLAALGMTGVVSIATKTGIVFEQIDGPGTGNGKFGYATRIRFVGDELFACGDMRQIYKRSDTGWLPFDFGLRETDPRKVGCSLNDIAGPSTEFLFTVGDRGRIYRHVDGRWEDCDSPTNVSLERVLVDELGDVWACGGMGTLLRGNGASWEVVNFSSQTGEAFWGLARYKGHTYVCSSQALYKFEGSGLVRMRINGFTTAPHRLASDADFLWVMSSRELARYDGEEWTMIAV